MSSALSRRVYVEADEREAWMAVMRSNGEIRIKCNSPAHPHMSQSLFAIEMLRDLNKRIANSGAWTVGWCHGYTRMILIWMDGDGDPQFTVEVDDRIADIIKAGVDHFTAQCYEAWAKWCWSQDILDLKPEQTFKKAQGERP